MRKNLEIFHRDQYHVIDGDAFVRNPYPELKKVTIILELFRISASANIVRSFLPFASLSRIVDVHADTCILIY